MNWTLFTFLGDSTLLMPASLIMAAIFVCSGRKGSSAPGWILAFGGVGALVCVSKILFMGWGIGNRSLDFTGFSGHTALSAALWPVALWMICSRISRRAVYLAITAGYLLAVAIGYSRLAINAHSVSEVISGWLVGAAGSGLFFITRRPPLPVLHLPRGALLVLLLPLLLIATEQKAPTQKLLGHLAIYLSGAEKPFVRSSMTVDDSAR